MRRVVATYIAKVSHAMSVTAALSCLVLITACAPAARAPAPTAQTAPTTQTEPSTEVVAAVAPTDPTPADADGLPFKGAPEIVPELAPDAVDCVPDCTKRGSLRRIGKSDLNVPFEFDSAELTPRARAQLDELARAMAMLPEGWVYEIGGHTDDVGGPRYNLHLSIRRAEAAARYLNQVHGVPVDRLVPVGHGEDSPLDWRNPNSGVNRRVEVKPLDV